MGKYKWTTLEHNGVLFPPPYQPHNVPVIYNGVELRLSAEAEEAATMYAKYLDTDYIRNATFRRNFWKDWRKILGRNHEIQNLENVNFSLIQEYLNKQKEEKKLISKEEKDKQKELREKEEEPYKTAMLDGTAQPVGNFRIEPPGIFIGRGSHPLIGRIKKRIVPHDIIINIGKEATVPPGNWYKVIHDRKVIWLAAWLDSISGKMKYVWLGNKSSLKAESDKAKFDLARKLRKKVKHIRCENYKLFSDPDPIKQQLAVALYLIDKLAIRVGNEKNTDVQSDTVGTTTLLVSNIQLHDFNKITLNFLGKDSIRYTNTVSVEPLVHMLLNKFIQNKTKDDQIFELINPTLLNKYLQSYMPNLTAKVFRTYNASYTFQKELNKISKKLEQPGINAKDEFRNANLKVAVLCNHQKQVSKSFGKSIEAINNKIKELRSKAKKSKNKESKLKIKEKIKALKNKKKLKSELKGVALQTSLDNYIDPRITVAFTKKNNLDLGDFFNKKMMEQFWWALDTPASFKF